MSDAHADIVELIRYAGQRLTDRMGGLTDKEWSWRPIGQDEKMTIRWRLDHIAEAVGLERNWVWLGASGSDAPRLTAADSAEAAIAAVESTLQQFIALSESLGEDLDLPCGPAAGPYAEASRRSLVLHAADELIHHAAEAAILRDLYAGL